MSIASSRSCFHGVLYALMLLVACRDEPYPLEGVLTGELPDEDLDVEAELADPGGEMHEPPDDDREYGPEHCTDEEVAAHEKSVTHGDRVDDEGIVCPKHTPSPAPSRTTAPPR